MSITSALIFGSIFWRMGKSQTSIQDRMGLLQVQINGLPALFLSVSYAKGCLQCDKDSLTLSALACLSFKNSIKYDWIANFTCLLWLCSFCQYK